MTKLVVGLESEQKVARLRSALSAKKSRVVLTNETTLRLLDTSQSGRSSLRRVCRLTN